jgi:hypothetical protein
MTLGYPCYLVFETLLGAPQSPIGNCKSEMRKMGRSEIRFVTGAGGPPLCPESGNEPKPASYCRSVC